MRRESLAAFAPFAAAAGLLAAALGCAAYRYQHQPPPAAPPPAAAAGPESAPASAGFRAAPTGAQVAAVRGEIAVAKQNLEREGKYRCCVAPSCNECMLRDGECHCRDVVEKQGPCCGECTEAWIEGHGTIDGISALDLLERKKAMLRQKQGGAPGGAVDPHPDPQR
jgi:hypothetical protein